MILEFLDFIVIVEGKKLYLLWEDTMDSGFHII